MKTRYMILTVLTMLASPFIAKYCHATLVDTVVIVIGIPLLTNMAYHIWRIADAIDRLSDNR